MKKVFTILITFLLALSLIGVASAADDVNAQSGDYRVVASDGSLTHVKYSVSDSIIISIPATVNFVEGHTHIHDNVTVVKSQIASGKYLNIFVVSAHNWDMMLDTGAVNEFGNKVYEANQKINYKMRYDNSSNGVDVSDPEITRNADVGNGVYTGGICILSLESGVTEYELGIGFEIISTEYDKSGNYEDNLKFTFGLSESPFSQNNVVRYVPYN